jgi:proteasome alpha subunit
VLAGPDTVLDADSLEVAILERARPRRKFRRIRGEALAAILAG